MCPSRLLAEAPWAGEVVEWWYWSSTFDGMSGAPVGPPEWPYPGGMLHQPARLAEAVKVLRVEWAAMQEDKTKATTRDEAPRKA